MERQKQMITIARIVFAIPFIIFGLFHFMNGSGMAQQVLSGWPAATFLVYLSGAGLLLAGSAILIDKVRKLASLLLALELLIFILAVHVPGVMSGKEQIVQMSMIGMLKDLALIGGALFAASIPEKEKASSESGD